MRKTPLRRPSGVGQWSCWVALLVVVLVSACRAPAEPSSDKVVAFGSTINVDIVGVPKPVAQAALAEIHIEMQTLHRDSGWR